MLKTLIRPWARGPGASATGGADTGDGDREGGIVAVGMVGYECRVVVEMRVDPLFTARRGLLTLVPRDALLQPHTSPSMSRYRHILVQTQVQSNQ